ncbi:hypothetical protein H8356DRAFT_1344551 [Neocallimastix lanati (nom. inval.)]|nr:hypothetical protein H8356DRAFT_1344551 [Neocallimastix sp. JGI-2020a]
MIIEFKNKTKINRLKDNGYRSSINIPITIIVNEILYIIPVPCHRKHFTSTKSVIVGKLKFYCGYMIPKNRKIQYLFYAMSEIGIKASTMDRLTEYLNISTLTYEIMYSYSNNSFVNILKLNPLKCLICGFEQEVLYLQANELTSKIEPGFIQHGHQILPVVRASKGYLYQIPYSPASALPFFFPSLSCHLICLRVSNWGFVGNNSKCHHSVKAVLMASNSFSVIE